MKIIANNEKACHDILPVTDTHPIIGGNAPDTPPITTFCTEVLFS